MRQDGIIDEDLNTNIQSLIDGTFSDALSLRFVISC